MLAGEAAGSKLTKANELGIPVHDEAWLLEQIANSASGGISDNSANDATGNKKEKPAAQGNGQLSLF